MQCATFRQNDCGSERPGCSPAGRTRGRQLAARLEAAGYHLRITRDLDEAKDYFDAPTPTCPMRATASWPRRTTRLCRSGGARRPKAPSLVSRRSQHSHASTRLHGDRLRNPQGRASRCVWGGRARPLHAQHERAGRALLLRAGGHSGDTARASSSRSAAVKLWIPLCSRHGSTCGNEVLPTSGPRRSETASPTCGSRARGRASPGSSSPTWSSLPIGRFAAGKQPREDWAIVESKLRRRKGDYLGVGPVILPKE